MPLTAPLEDEVPVLIVGGGGAGLTASMLLAVQGVEHLLVSARPTTSDLPKAHVLNQRAMEVLDDVDVAEAIAQRSTPAEQMAATAFYAGFAGPDPDYGRRLGRLECWGAGGADESWRAASAWRQLNLPQIRLEPLLKERAEQLSPGRIRFAHELIDLEQDGEGVRALIRDNGASREYVVACDYLFGADGGRRIPGLVGVEYEGLRVVTQTATLHVSADFSRWAKDPDVLIRWIFSPQAGQRSLENAINHFSIGATLGISPENPAEHNLELLRRMWSGRSQDAELRSNALRVMRAQSMEFSELGVEYGYSYESEAVLPDGNLPPEPIDDIRVHEPSTRPGAPLPHAWVEDEDGNRWPIKDLVRPGRFLLIAGEDGHAWCEEARHLAAAANLPLDAVRIGHLDGDLFDPRCAWLRYRQIATDGAILVRPDRFVAWRALSACTDPQSVLADALGQILARPIDAIVGTAGVR